MRSLGVCLLCGALGFGCGASQNTYAAAAVAAGLGVAAAAVNRAATDECWGQCSHGLICDPEAGVCVEPPETVPEPPPPETAEDRGCIQEDDGRWLCPDDPEAFAPPLGSATPSAQPSQQPAPAPDEAGTPAAER